MYGLPNILPKQSVVALYTHLIPGNELYSFTEVDADQGIAPSQPFAVTLEPTYELKDVLHNPLFTNAICTEILGI